MSKIPQGEWSAIAARYQDGESISKIARSYGCTPPAIHYILKRQRGSTASDPSPPTIAPPDAPLVHPVSQPMPPSGQLDRVTTVPVLVRTHAAPPRAADTPRLVAEQPTDPPRAEATPGLDQDLHERAEAAIEVFRTSFDAALIEGSPGVRERLRQAASDLMRVAARTTIVLDRLSANADRISRAPNYPRSAHTR
jgi:transposase-like protein